MTRASQSGSWRGDVFQKPRQTMNSAWQPMETPSWTLTRSPHRMTVSVSLTVKRASRIRSGPHPVDRQTTTAVSQKMMTCQRSPRRRFHRNPWQRLLPARGARRWGTPSQCVRISTRGQAGDATFATPRRIYRPSAHSGNLARVEVRSPRGGPGTVADSGTPSPLFPGNESSVRNYTSCSA